MGIHVIEFTVSRDPCCVIFRAGEFRPECFFVAACDRDVDLGLKNFSNPICLLHTQKVLPAQDSPGSNARWYAERLLESSLDYID
jgi:hypothetical protein